MQANFEVTTNAGALAALRARFEGLASDPSLNFKRSPRGTYRNPALARDWKWFVLGASAAVQPAAPSTETMVRFCPGCGSVGPVPDTYRDCCPDGADSREIPASLAAKCHNLFQIALDRARQAAPAQMGADADLLEQAASMLEALENDERNRGNYSSAEAARCSAHAVRRLACAQLAADRAARGAAQAAPSLVEFFASVFNTLASHDPHWDKHDCTTTECAVAAINRLAAKAAPVVDVLEALKAVTSMLRTIQLDHRERWSNERTNMTSAYLRMADKALAATKAQAAPVVAPELTQAARDVLAERQRQIRQEGYDSEHDDSHVNDEIAALAALFIMPEGAREWDATSTGYGDTLGDAMLPRDWEYPGFGSRRRQLVKGAAMALAELERRDRAAARAQELPL